jgi:HAD superfamily hydrolase (TIGR01509 family)
MYSYIFDIGGVLINYDFHKVIENLAGQYECDLEVLNGLFTYDTLYQVETGRISCSDFYEGRICRALPGISYEAWIRAFEEDYTVNAAAFDLMLELKRKGRKVYILSNLAEFHKIAIERKVPGFFQYCDHNFFSFEMGYHKPEPEIFRTLCETIGEKPENCVFFDDVPKNVEGARKAGMKGVVYSDGEMERIREEIRRLEEETA